MEMKTEMEACTSHISQDMSGALYDVSFLAATIDSLFYPPNPGKRA